MEIRNATRELDYLEARSSLAESKLKEWTCDCPCFPSLCPTKGVDVQEAADELRQQVKEKQELVRKLETTFVGDFRPSYMAGRSRATGPLEHLLGKPPFQRFKVETGVADARLDVGELKALVRVIKPGVRAAACPAHHSCAPPCTPGSHLLFFRATPPCPSE